MRNIILNRTRYKYSEHPYLLGRKRGNREPVHAPATSWQDLTDENKAEFMAIAESIKLISEKVRIYAFGSRTSGWFTDESDYDIIVVGASKAEQQEIKTKLQNNKVDIKFNTDTPKWRHSIRIPIQ